MLLEPFWASWRDLWGILGHVGRVMEPLRDFLGGSWEGLGRFLGGLGGFQRPSGKHFLRIFWFLKQFLKFVKKPRKTNGFSLIFEVPGGFWGSENPKKSIKRR